ncbi:MAG: bifunctional metallophosphatase/5'-nucleotidase [Lawsonibacter sp.]|jgi:5'-nucleotidase/UDP-sugar diphosphatase|nr:bifunctional metallophosphatase/5'-nucleotidase [Lawsonibacter sp.]
MEHFDEMEILMKRTHRISAFLLAFVLLCLILPAWAASPQDYTATVLFTHDLHSHFLPQADGAGGESGGYARLKTALDRERARHPDALTVDGGDFSIGSLIQTLYTTQGAELRTMGALGYDAAAVGNHEFDHTASGFASMLNAVVSSGDRAPALLMANYKPAADSPDKLDVQRAMAAYGVRDYMLLERGGITYGIFGLMGEDSHACAPSSGFVLEDMAASAQRCVNALKEQGAQFIICLSHAGTNEKKKLSEDERLAEKVPGIDLIVSGHTHSTLTEPLVVGDTYIVSAGPYCRNLGSITLTWSENGEKTLADYHLTTIDESIPDDREISLLIESWKRQVGGTYLGRYGMTYDQTLTRTDFDLAPPVSGVQSGNALGELVADSFRWAVKNLEADSPDVFTVAVTADGVLRAPLSRGELTTSMAFDVLSMGVGSDGTSGFPLVGVYLTGRELKAIAEVDASVTPLMPAAQLYTSGLVYSFNTHRMFFNRVTEVRVSEFGGGLGEIDDDNELYRVVTGMYSAQMLSTVKSKSLGLLSLEPKMADGSPVNDFEACILRDENGSEIKEWYALAAYLQSFGEEGVPSRYAQPDGRKHVSHSWNPFELVTNLNWIGIAALLVLAAAIALAVFLVRWLAAAKKRRRYGGSRWRKW